MKRTKSMIYNQTQESIELTHFAANTQSIYPQIQNTVRNLAKKFAKGVYDAEKAIDAFYYIACSASDLYKKWYGYGFSVSDRFSAAVDLRDYFSENIENNDI